MLRILKKIFYLNFIIFFSGRFYIYFVNGKRIVGSQWKHINQFWF
jgi:hypothetical protein